MPTPPSESPKNTAHVSSSMRIYLVGGAVRDRLLGLPVKDRDWMVTGATPAAMQAQGFQAVGQDFPVFLHPKTHEEYALARTERKTGKGYQGFQCYAAADVRLEDDLMRRDLTINAMAESAEGKLIDPYGGQRDLQAKILRHVSPAFREDPVRILRIARFAARFAHLGFKIADETRQLMQTMVAAGEVEALVPERVWQELDRALGEVNPEQFFLTLRDCGALAILFPEIDRLFGVPQKKQYHPEVDTGIHTMMVLQQAVRLSEDRRIRFAALTHDLGKGTTPEDILPSHHGHESRSLALVTALCERYRVPNSYQHLAELTAYYHGQIHKAFELRVGTLLSLFEKISNGYRQHTHLADILLACHADARGRTGFEQVDYPQQAYCLALYEASRHIDIQAIIARGYRGAEIKAAIRHERLARLSAAKKQWRTDCNLQENR